MKLCRHFYGAKRNVYLEYDFLHATEQGDELKVRFTRLRGLEVDYADTIAPACAVWELHGFAEDEMGELKSFLRQTLPFSWKRRKRRGMAMPTLSRWRSRLRTSFGRGSRGIAMRRA